MTRTQHMTQDDRLAHMQQAGSCGSDSHDGERVKLPLARMVGAMISILMLGAVLLLLPFRAHDVSMANLIACAGGLLANGMAMASHQALKSKSDALSFFALFTSLVFAVLAGISLSITVSLAVVLVMDAFIHRKGASLLEIGLSAGVATSVFVLALYQAWPDSSAMMMLVLAYLPVLAGLYSNKAHFFDRIHKEGEAQKLDTAFLTAALAQSNQILLMVDRGGMIETSSWNGNDDKQSQEDESDKSHTSLLTAGLYLGDAILISDRVPLFQALSEAIHKGTTCENLLIRLREAMPEGGYSQPPCFIAHRACVMPARGIAARAIVALSPLDESASETITPKAVPEFSARAIHDFVSPFNAGLGFLEILADDKLAPKQDAQKREFAQKAHHAVMTAFRCATLLTRVLAAQDSTKNAKHRPPQTFATLLKEAAAEIGVRDQSGENCIQFDYGTAANRLVVHPDKLRFALQVMLTTGLHSAHEGEKLLLIARDGDLDCQIMLRKADFQSWDLSPVNEFERALETRAMELTGGQFSRDPSLGLVLTIPNAFTHVSVFPHEKIQIPPPKHHPAQMPLPEEAMRRSS